MPAPVPLQTDRHVYTVDDAAVAVTLHDPMPKAAVPEALVQDLWRTQRFDTGALVTHDEQPITVYDPGRLNTDAGPDFLNAHLRIGTMEWHGNVEIHVTSGTWLRHDHADDARYNSVVLHVTLYPDVWTGRLTRPDGSPLPELVLAPRLQTPLRRLLHDFRTRPSADALPCATRIDDVPEAIQHDWIRRLSRERLQAKCERLRDASGATLLHERLFAGLGYAKNDAPMETLAHRLPLDALSPDLSRRDLEALHFGVAGLLPTPDDLLDADRATADYAMDLRTRFARLKAQAPCAPMNREAWTFFRLRPTNFPPLRIAQGLAWLTAGSLLRTHPLATLRAALADDRPVRALRHALAATPGPFWQTHFRLVTSTKPRDPSLGRSRIDTLLVNAVLPVLLRDARDRNDAAQTDAVWSVLHDLPAARDRVVRRFRDLGVSVGSAAEAQGVHRLYRRYCRAGGCLQCAVGQHLLQRPSLDNDAPDA